MRVLEREQRRGGGSVSVALQDSGAPSELASDLALSRTFGLPSNDPSPAAYKHSRKRPSQDSS